MHMLKDPSTPRTKQPNTIVEESGDQIPKPCNKYLTTSNEPVHSLPVQRHAFLLWLLLQAASKDDLQQVINTCSKNLGCKLAMCRTSEQKVAILPYEGNRQHFILYCENKTEENPLSRTEIIDSKPILGMSKCAGYNLLRNKV